MNKFDHDDEEACECKMKVVKNETRAKLWDLREKYYNIYKSLKEFMPNTPYVQGSHDYIMFLKVIETKILTYSSILDDIDKILGV